MSGAANDEITLKCKGDKRTLKASKSFLAKHSKYFEGLSGFGDQDEAVVFDPQIIPFDILQRIIGYIHLGCVKHALIEEMEQLFTAADYLQADFLIASLIAFLHQDVDKRMREGTSLDTKKQDLLVLLRLYPAIFRYEAEKKTPHTKINFETCPRGSRGLVATTCCVCPKLLIALNFRRLMNELAVLQMDEEVLRDLLSYDMLMLDEDEVLRVVKMWCYYRLEERRGAFERMVKCVRVDNPTVTTKLLMDELTCSCRVPCDCLTSKDFVIQMLSTRLRTATTSTAAARANDPKRKSLSRRASTNNNNNQMRG